MTVRVSGIFESIDAAEAAVRSLMDIPVYKRRISRVQGRKPGIETVASSGIASQTVSTGFAVGSIGQRFGQGIFLPAPLFGSGHTNHANSREVQLEVWVAPLDVQETIGHLINAHGSLVRLC